MGMYLSTTTARRETDLVSAPRALLMMPARSRALAGATPAAFSQNTQTSARSRRSDLFTRMSPDGDVLESTMPDGVVRCRGALSYNERDSHGRTDA
jgi:hypothetical protein